MLNLTPQYLTFYEGIRVLPLRIYYFGETYYRV